MAKIYTSIDQLVGNTPLLELNNIAKEKQLGARLLAKLEYLNPAGSVKDRVALQMILDAEEKGLLKPGDTIIEPTSGNTGIGLAAIASGRGYKVIIPSPAALSPDSLITPPTLPPTQPPPARRSGVTPTEPWTFSWQAWAPAAR